MEHEAITDNAPQPEVLSDLGDGPSTPLQHKNPEQEPPAPEPVKPQTASEAIKAAMAKVAADEAKGDDPQAAKKGAEDPDPKGKDADSQTNEKPKARSEEETYKASRRELGRLEKELERLTGKSNDEAFGEEGGDHTKDEVAAKIAEVRAELSKLQSEGKDVKPPAHLLPSELQMWTKTPRSIQAAVERMTQGYETQIAEHKEAVEFRSSLKQYDEMAKAAGIPIAEAMERYVSMDKKLAANFGQGLAEIAQSFGKNPVEAVAQFMRSAGVLPQQLGAYLQGQPAQPQQPQGQPQRPSDPHVAQLQQELAQMKQYMAQQQQAQIEVQKKADAEAKYREIEEKIINPARAEMPRYDELADHIAKYLKSGMIDPSLSPDIKLREAYHAVDRIYPALHVANAATASDLDDNVASLAAKKSISGAPGKSSTSSGKPKIMSIRESILAADRAHRL